MARNFLTRDAWDVAVRRGDLSGRDAPPLRKQATVKFLTRALDPATGMRDVEFILSTPSIDREMDVIDVNGWDLSNFQRNPVVLWAHDYWTPPIGRALQTWTEGEELRGLVRFTPQDVNPFGYQIYRMVEGGFLNAVSVGFQPVRYAYNEQHAGYDFIEQELLEFSVVPIPANPEALIAAAASGIDVAPLRDWAKGVLARAYEPRPSVTLSTTPPSPSWTAMSDPTVTVTPSATGTSDRIVSGYVSESTTGGVSPDSVRQTLSCEDVAAMEWEYPPTDDTLTVRTAAVVAETLDKEDDVKEAIEALTEIIKELRTSVDALTGQVKALEATPTPEPEPEPETKTEPEPEPEITEEDIRVMAREVFATELTAETGRLPD